MSKGGPPSARTEPNPKRAIRFNLWTPDEKKNAKAKEAENQKTAEQEIEKAAFKIQETAEPQQPPTQVVDASDVRKTIELVRTMPRE